MKSKLVWMAIILLILVVSAGNNNETQTSSDPLISLSYLEQRLTQQRQELITELSGAVGASFVVVNIPAGKSLTGYEGTEIILRAGTATAIDGELGGVSNLTKGIDLKLGDPVDFNNLLVIPRSDNRGIRAITSSIVLVKGRYTID